MFACFSKSLPLSRFPKHRGSRLLPSSCWGFRGEMGSQRVFFHQSDRKASGASFQTKTVVRPYKCPPAQQPCFCASAASPSTAAQFVFTVSQSQTLCCSQQASPSYTEAHSACDQVSAHLSKQPRSEQVWEMVLQAWQWAAKASSINSRAPRVHRGQTAVINVTWLPDSQTRDNKNTTKIQC